MPFSKSVHVMMGFSPRLAAMLTAIDKEIRYQNSWNCPNNDMVYPWKYHGVNYYRNSLNEVWTVKDKRTLGEWVGVYNRKTYTLDTTAIEPEWDESEE
jgi:hypothetical protein